MPTSRSFPAKFDGACAGCGGKITTGSPIRMNDGDAYHVGCAPTGHPRADASEPTPTVYRRDAHKEIEVELWIESARWL